MSRPASSRWIAFPTSVEPVNATLSIPSARTRCAPVEPSPVTMLTTPGGTCAWRQTSANSSARERRRLGRLQHDRVPARERRRDLPREHQEREVPRDDLRRHAERARAPSREGVLELVRPARVVEEVRRRERESTSRDSLIGLPPSSDSATASSRARSWRIRAIRNSTFARSDGFHALHASNPSRAASTASATSFAPGLRDLGERLLGRGRDRREPRARPRGDLLAADEEAVPLLERDDLARLGRGRVLPGPGRGQRAPLLLDGAHQSSVNSSGER